MIALLLLACRAPSGPLEETRRELWEGTIDGDAVTIAAVLGGDRVGLFEKEEPGEYWKLMIRVEAPWVLDVLPPIGRSKDTVGTLGDDLVGMPFLACPVPHGLVFRAKDRWFGAWRVGGGTIAMTHDEITGETCPTVSFDPGAAAKQAADQRWCRLLDDASFADAAAACIVGLDRKPGGATWNAELKTRHHGDARRREALANAAIDSLIADPATDDLPAIGHALAVSEFARVTSERCTAAPCDPKVIGAALSIVEKQRTSPLSVDVCEPAERFAAAAGDAGARVRDVLRKDCAPIPN